MICVHSWGGCPCLGNQSESKLIAAPAAATKEKSISVSGYELNYTTMLRTGEVATAANKSRLDLASRVATIASHSIVVVALLERAPEDSPTVAAGGCARVEATNARPLRDR